ncbi:hypothetical protein [Cognatiyoonia sp. IB215182]|uniref:hypothetical protein n=1 Tax=Cognatiyoonia sp. IB215182 TaxID=3097353 RepID=UPI002A0BA7D5|nr:hypothetical protein [Cognatiyoonia sp. IB215182]MDX8350910.1 hypothetical protein [Cognatiyoonia sp. IB215182]
MARKRDKKARAIPDQGTGSQVTERDLSEALRICLQSSQKAWGQWPWQTEAWLDVIEVYGESKSGAMLETFEKMHAAFFAIKPRHSSGSTVIQDAKNVQKDFQALFPDAPSELVARFEHEYLRSNR